MYFFEILYLSVYAHRRPFLMLCIGKCVGSLNMYMVVVLVVLVIMGVAVGYVVLVVLYVCCDLVFYIRSSRCLVEYVLHMLVCIRYGMLVHKISF